MPGKGCEVRRVKGVPVVSSPAEIDVTNAGELLRAIRSCTDAGHTVLVVDMSETTFCDSAALNQLLQEHKRLAAAGGGLRLLVGAGSVIRLLAIVGVDRLLPTFTSLEEALAEAPASSHPA